MNCAGIDIVNVPVARTLNGAQFNVRNASNLLVNPWQTTAPGFVTNSSLFVGTAAGVQVGGDGLYRATGWFSIPNNPVVRAGTSMELTVNGALAPQVPTGLFGYSRATSGHQHSSNVIPGAVVELSSGDVVSWRVSRRGGTGGGNMFVPVGQAYLELIALS